MFTVPWAGRLIRMRRRKGGSGRSTTKSKKGVKRGAFPKEEDPSKGGKESGGKHSPP